VVLWVSQHSSRFQYFNPFSPNRTFLPKKCPPTTYLGYFGLMEGRVNILS